MKKIIIAFFIIVIPTTVHAVIEIPSSVHGFARKGGGLNINKFQVFGVICVFQH